MALANKKNIGNIQNGKKEIISVEYDFANDTGDIDDYDVLENIGDNDMIVELLEIHVETAVTSGGAANLDLGVGDGGVEILSDEDATTGQMTADLILLSATPKVVLTNGDKIVFGIETAALTAGKFHMVFEVRNTQFNT